MRAVFVALSLVLLATPAMAYPRLGRGAMEKPAETTTTSSENAPFRAKLVSNAAVARRAASTFASIAKQPVPAKLSTADKKRYSDHSKWLSDSAAKLAAVHERMQKVLEKGDKSPVTEVATTNMEFVNVRDAIESESRRFASLPKPASARHTTAMSAVRADK